MSKILVAYFSASGSTEKVARLVSESVNGTLHEIVPEVRYTRKDLNWMDQKSRSSVEMKNKAMRPAIIDHVENMDEYDVVMIGFPIWWYVAPTIINTFLEKYDFSKKTVIPFFTSGGSGLGNTMEELAVSVSPETKWITGKRLTGSKNEIQAWVNSLGL